MAAAWTVRPGRPEDVPSILELFRETFERPRSAEAYRWKFFESPWAVGAPTFVAERDGRVVGHIAGTGFRIRLGSREVTAVHSCDSMVARELRGQGIMSALAPAAHRSWAESGAELILALPTQNWVKLNRRVDYRETFELGWRWRPLRAVLERRPPRGVEVGAVAEATEDLDELWQRARADYPALVVRDRAWVAYRYAGALEAGYVILVARARGRPAGYLVYRGASDDRPAWIADLFTAPADGAARSALLRHAFAELRRKGAESVRTLAARGTPFAHALRREWFVSRKGAYDVRVGPLASDVPWDLLRDPGRFFLMGGDFDVV